MRTALAYLRLAARPEEFEPGDLVEALRRPTRYLKRERIRELGRAGSVDELFKLITYYEDWEQESVEEFVGDLRLLRRALKKEGVAVAIRRLRTDVGLGSDMDTLDRSTGRLVGGGHLDDLQALEQTAHGMQELGEFEELLRGVLGQESKAGVRLSSVHRVKGQEWPKVVVIGARKGVLPHRLADELEEETPYLSRGPDPIHRRDGRVRGPTSALTLRKGAQAGGPIGGRCNGESPGFRTRRSREGDEKIRQSGVQRWVDSQSADVVPRAGLGLRV